MKRHGLGPYKMRKNVRFNPYEHWIYNMSINGKHFYGSNNYTHVIHEAMGLEKYFRLRHLSSKRPNTIDVWKRGSYNCEIKIILITKRKHHD